MLCSRFDLGVTASRLGEARKITFYVGHEDGHANLGETFRNRLKGNCLSRSCGSCDETVAVAKLWQDERIILLLIRSLANENAGNICHSGRSLLGNSVWSG